MAFVDVVVDPSTQSPDMAFNNGEVANNAAVMDPSLPSVPGPPSDWSVIEWDKTDYLNPLAMTEDDASLSDTNYGAPLYTWQAADGLTTLSVYSANGNAQGGAPYIYDLQESDGTLNGGGANLFLSSSISSQTAVTFNHPINYSLDAKLSVASVSGPSIDLAQVFTGFILTFNASSNPNYNAALPTISAFMQIGIANSSGVQARYLSQDGNTITYSYTLPEDNHLAFQPTSGGPTALTYNLNQYLDDMIAHDPQLPSQAQDLGLWALGSMYIGEETENGTVAAPNLGQVSVGLQVSNLQVETDSSQTVSYEDPSSFEVQPTPPPLFILDDSSQGGVTATITADSYIGPLGFLSHNDAFSYNGSDSVTISAVGATNPLIASGSGNDVLTGSSTGTSVLDGGTGANIEADAGNADTTFLQNGYVHGATWDFLENFHGADKDILFGYIPGLSRITVQASGGAGSYTGATVTLTPGNGNGEVATFVGVSAAQLHGCSATIDGVPAWVIWS